MTAEKNKAKKNSGEETLTKENSSTQSMVKPSKKAESVTSRDLLNAIVEGFGENGSSEKQKKARTLIRRYLKQCIDKYDIAPNYNLVLLYDETRMVQSDANNIYTAVTQFSERKPIFLLLHSTGGFVGPAYLIGKTLQEYSNQRLNIVVPRRAKSAATLLCCAANQVHMGSLSELGPIDPQIEGLPALGLKSAIEHIAELVAKYPHATDLFANYMSQTIQPIHLGYYERVAESAVQYAKRLLEPHAGALKQIPEKIAKRLVYEYKDHGFVIDKHEAQDIFGPDVVRHNTSEYQLGNDLYQKLAFIGRIADIIDHNFYMIGSIVSDPTFMKKKNV